MPVFTTDVDLTPTAFIKTKSPDEADTIAAQFGELFHIKLEMAGSSGGDLSLRTGAAETSYIGLLG